MRPRLSKEGAPAARGPGLGEVEVRLRERMNIEV
jgi:hypothetical protein